MIDVLIVAKTHMSHNSCIGGVLPDGTLVRLLDSNENNQPINSTYEVGQVYSIDYVKRENIIPPHNEDILVLRSVLKRSFPKPTLDKLAPYLVNKLHIHLWYGSPDNLFDSLLEWTSNGSGYISANHGLPKHSVGFWISDKDLDLVEINNTTKYEYQNSKGKRLITFKGFQNTVPRIPAGTLLRVSLARWWAKPNETEKKCYLQLSGWYANLEAKIATNPFHLDDDDLPF